MEDSECARRTRVREVAESGGTRVQGSLIAIVVMFEIKQLRLQVCRRPERGAVQALSPKGHAARLSF